MSTRRLNLPDRYCPAPECGKLLVRRDDERPERWRARTSCDRACAAVLRRTPAVHRAETEVRHCAKASCGKRLVRGDGERLNAFSRRSFCDDTCRRQRSVGETRACEGPDCAEVIVRAAGMSDARWAERRFHDHACHTRAQQPNGQTLEQRRAAENRRSRTRRAELRKRSDELAAAGLSVFGDRAPVQAWRPAAWRDPALARGTAHTAA